MSENQPNHEQPPAVKTELTGRINASDRKTDELYHRLESYRQSPTTRNLLTAVNAGPWTRAKSWFGRILAALNPFGITQGLKARQNRLDATINAGTVRYNPTFEAIAGKSPIYEHTHTDSRAEAKDRVSSELSSYAQAIGSKISLGEALTTIYASPRSTSMQIDTGAVGSKMSGAEFAEWQADMQEYMRRAQEIRGGMLINPYALQEVIRVGLIQLVKNEVALAYLLSDDSIDAATKSTIKAEFYRRYGADMAPRIIDMNMRQVRTSPQSPDLFDDDEQNFD